jgi:hypothetical protein
MAAPGWYSDPNDPAQLRWWDGSAWTANVRPAARPPPIPDRPVQPSADPPSAALTAAAGILERRVDELEERIAQLTREERALQTQLVETRDIQLLQEVGLYEYSHPLDSSAAYKEALAAIDVGMHALVKAGEAATGTKKWAINGSEKDGARMVADFCKLMLRAYNTEADNLVRTLKPYSVKSAIERLQKMRASISRLGASMKIEITERYHALRIEELQLTADFLAKVAEEKEKEREEKERLREEETARREYECEQARLEKEKAHYEVALDALRAKGDQVATAEAERKLAEIQSAIEGVLNRAANIRAGYVYVISNVGSFGDSVVKIGMTRRLDPMDRVRELGDASVPFRFDVHAIIFSDDAVGLETALHQRFAERKVNFVNPRREFFFVKPIEVRAALLELQGDLLRFVEVPEALEWHQSQAALRARGASEFKASSPP